ncbi:MAG: class I SAM-dependent methyltransferase [Planctomycetes bacterium]|nr:class I SAM-dependent methyltransferase [Planctomycetota bacterium]
MIFVPEFWHLEEEAQRLRYANHDNTPENTGYARMLGQFVDQLRPIAPPPCRVLDIGCGPNQVLVSLLRKAGYDAYGQDPLYGISPLESAPYDAIVSTETIEHFSNPRLEFDRMVGLLRGGGVIAITTHFHHGPSAIHDWWYARDLTHISFYSRATMSWIAQHFGFEQLDCDIENLCAMRRQESP